MACAYAVKVAVAVLGHVVVEHNVDTLNIHTTTEEVSGNKDALLELLELLVAVETMKI